MAVLRVAFFTNVGLDSAENGTEEKERGSDMKKKKVNSILKGMAGVGVALGGVSVLTDADLVYAAELEEELSEQEEIPTLEQQASQSAAEADSVSDANSISADDSNSEVQSTSGSNADSTATSDLAVQSVSNADSETASESFSAVESTSESTASTIESMSGSISESAASETSEYKSLSEVAYQIDSLYHSASTAFKEKHYDDPYLEKLLSDIAAAQEKAEATTNSGSYYRAADKLANLLIQYKFYQEGYVDDIEYSNWVSDTASSKYVQNYVRVTYKAEDGSTNYAYFDYVTEDADGNVLFGTKDESNRAKFDHIQLLEKTPIFENQASEGETKDEFSFKTDTEGNILGYQLNGEEISEGTVEFVDEVSGKVTSKKTTSVTGNNYRGYTVTETTQELDEDGNVINTVEQAKRYDNLKKFTGKGKVYFSEADFNNGNDDYHQKRSELTDAETKKSNVDSTVESLSKRASSNSESNASLLSEIQGSASDSLDSAVSESIQISASASDSASTAKATSESNSTSADTSASAARSTSEGNSTSAADSASTAKATSEENSTSASDSASTVRSLSESTSRVLRGSEGEDQPSGDGGYNRPASVTAPVASDTTEIADEDVPLTDGADLFDDTDADDVDAPVADDSDDAELTDIADEDVPLAVINEDDLTELPDEDIPLSDNPETGDAMTVTWLGTAAAAVAGLFGARKGRKRKDDFES